MNSNTSKDLRCCWIIGKSSRGKSCWNATKVSSFLSWTGDQPKLKREDLCCVGEQTTSIYRRMGLLWINGIVNRWEKPSLLFFWKKSFCGKGRWTRGIFGLKVQVPANCQAKKMPKHLFAEEIGLGRKGERECLRRSSAITILLLEGWFSCLRHKEFFWKNISKSTFL